jgi:uncharacterized membrane protein YjjB (DUF3815 family)
MSAWDLARATVWAALFAGAVGVLFTAPPRRLAGTMLCGAAGRLALGVLMGWGVGQNWATLLASTVIVVIAVAVIREREASPVVLVSAVIPLGASVPIFSTIVGVIRVSSLQDEALSAASVALIASMGKAFTTFLAIGVGLAAGVVLTRLARREAPWSGS